MDPLSLSTGLNLGEKGLISVYGAGGKTTVIRSLARELSLAGSKVIVTTTTKIFPPPYPVVFFSGKESTAAELANMLTEHQIVALAAAPGEQGKLTGLAPSIVDQLFSCAVAPYMLVEADGAAGLPVKGYAAYEPVIPTSSSLLLPVIGMDALGRAVQAGEVHRPEKLAQITGKPLGEVLTAGDLTLVMKHMISLGRNQAPGARVSPLFNKTDLSDTETVRVLAHRASALNCWNRLLFISAACQHPVRFTFTLQDPAKPPVACVVLAAGVSRRMGQDKLFMPVGGKTVLQTTIDQIRAAGFEEIIVVARPDRAEEIKSPAPDIRIAVNNDYREGIAASVRTGVTAVGSSTQGILFALADQPLIPTEVYKAVLDDYRRHLGLATYPLYRGRRGNPVLFDRRTWPLLLNLKGDRGGSAILSSLPPGEIREVETLTIETTEDLDTPEDYQRLLGRVKDVDHGF